MLLNWRLKMNHCRSWWSEVILGVKFSDWFQSSSSLSQIWLKKTKSKKWSLIVESWTPSSIIICLNVNILFIFIYIFKITYISAHYLLLIRKHFHYINMTSLPVRNLPDVTAEDFTKVDLTRFKWIHWEVRMDPRHQHEENHVHKQQNDMFFLVRIYSVCLFFLSDWMIVKGQECWGTAEDDPTGG